MHPPRERQAVAVGRARGTLEIEADPDEESTFWATLDGARLVKLPPSGRRPASGPFRAPRDA